MKTTWLFGIVLLVAAVPSSRADKTNLVGTNTVIILHSFSGLDGGQPQSGLALGIDSNFYGTTFLGGANNLGTIYRVTPSGTLTTLHSIAPGEGSNSMASLVQGTDGDFYGTAYAGGSNDLGTVFKISPSTTFTTLYQFDGLDGSHPRAILAEGTDGNFYGTTIDGGTATSGTVFQITPTGTLVTLFNFDGSTNGGAPSAGVVLGSDGDFYGTTSAGGTNRYGTVFKITSAGTLTLLYTFNRNNDGRTPDGELVEANPGEFFGTTSEGGSSDFGTVFRITSSGTFSNLFRFSSSDGEHPSSKLALGTDGLLYGVTRGKGFGFGTVFMVGASGSFTRLYSFGGSTDGGFPYGGPIFGNDGFLYGTAAFGGLNLNGVIFRINGSPVGTYSGLVLQSGTPSNESSGLIDITFEEDRSFTAKLTLAGVRSSFKGGFDTSGNATNTVAQNKSGPLQVALQLGQAGTLTVITGTASNNVFSSDISANLSAFNRTNIFEHSAKFTLVLQPLDTNDTSVAQGYGYATLTVKKTGACKLQGVLADGTKLKAAGNVLMNNEWPFYSSLYQNRGASLGSISFAATNTISATVNWIKPTDAKAKFYPAGFSTTTTLDGAVYIKPTNGVQSIVGTNQLTFGGGNLPSNIVKTVVINPSGLITVSNPGSDNLTLFIQPNNGQFNGSIFNAGTGKTSKYQGLLVQPGNSGAGYFLGTNQSGFVVIEPIP